MGAIESTDTASGERQVKEIPRTYLRFFAECVANGERDIFCIGGRRSGKTFSTYGWLLSLAEQCPLKVTTLCAEFNPLQRTIEDFRQVTGLTVKGSTTEGLGCTLPNGSRFEFIHLDTKEKAQGTQCDILFVNEAVNVASEVLDTVAPGVRLFTIYNLNPTQRTKLLEKSKVGNTLVTTFRDNPYLTEWQVAEFEAMKERAMRPNATKYDTFMYQVYYLGNFSQMVGQVFQPPELISDEMFYSVPSKEVVGIDFGFAMDGDPTAVVGVKWWKNVIYAKEYIYQRGITSSEELARRMMECGLDSMTLMVADYGGLGKSRIRDLLTAGEGRWTGDLARGWQVYNCIKTGILDGVSDMLSMDGIAVTEGSTFLRIEMENYSFDDGGRPKGADHAIDAMRYGFTYLRRLGQ